MTRVFLEPELERIAGHLSWEEKLRLARKLYRWAMQLFVLLRCSALPEQARRLRSRRQKSSASFHRSTNLLVLNPALVEAALKTAAADRRPAEDRPTSSAGNGGATPPASS